MHLERVHQQAQFVAASSDLAAELAAAGDDERGQALVVAAVDVGDDVLEEDVGVLPRRVLEPHDAIHERPVLLRALAARVAERGEGGVEEAVVEQQLPEEHGGQAPILALGHDDAEQKDDMAADEAIEPAAVTDDLARTAAQKFMLGTGRS